MKNQLIIDDNSVYEIDEECMKKLRKNNQVRSVSERMEREKKESVRYHNTLNRKN